MAAFGSVPELTLDYIPCRGGARLVRAYGDDPCPVLPESIDGLPLVELGDYCFADRQRDSALPPENSIRRVAINGGSAGENRLGGSFLHRLTLPDSLRSVGSCAFYNCRKLTEISLGGGIRTVGSDVFLNTFALTQLTLRAAPDRPTGLHTILTSILTDLRVVFQPEDTILAAAHYPEYWMDIQEIPAHMLVQTFSGQGYHYRQCFKNGAPDWAEYDSVLPRSRSEDPPRTITMLALDRLRYPIGLSDAARTAYRGYLAEKAPDCIRVLLQRQDTDTLAALLALDILDEAALNAAAEQARKADSAAFAALLTDAAQKKRPAPAARKADRYDFDF